MRPRVAVRRKGTRTKTNEPNFIVALIYEKYETVLCIAILGFHHLARSENTKIVNMLQLIMGFQLNITTTPRTK